MTIDDHKTSYWNSAAGPREVLQLALPLFLSMSSMTIQVFIDRMFLTWYSKEAIAASIPAVCVLWVFVGPLNGIVMFANTFVAQYHGAGRNDRIGPAVGQALLVAFIAGVALCGLWPLAGFIFRAAGHAAAVIELEAAYFQTLLVSAAPMLVMNAASCFFGGLGRTWIVLLFNVVATAVNIILDYAFIFGRWGAPEMGIAGAGWATAAAYFVAAIVAIALMWSADERGEFGIRRSRGAASFLRPDADLLWRLLKFGGPAGLMMLVEVFAFTWFVLLVGRLGTTALAATNVAFNINMFAFGPMIGMGTATQILVGQRLGENRADLAARATWSALWLSLAYTFVLGAGYVLCPQLFLAPIRWYGDPDDYAALSELIIGLLRFVALYSLFDTSALIFGSALRGAGDTRFVMAVTFALAFGVIVVPCYFAADLLQGRLFAAWWLVTGYVMALGAALFARFQAGTWRSMRVIESVAVQVESAALCELPSAVEPVSAEPRP